MKYCKQCGRENEDDKKFCTGCGTSLSFVNSQENNHNNKKKKWKKLLFIILLIIILAGLSFVGYFFSNQQRLKREIESEDWINVEEIYEKMQSEGKEVDATKIMQETAESYKNNYINKTLPYDEAVKKINEIKAIVENDRIISEVLEHIEELYHSRTAFDLAQDYWNEEDYENAIIQYRFVIENDENYTVAAEKIVEGKVLYKTQIVSEIEEKANAEQYEEVSDLIGRAKAILGEDEEISALSIKYELAGVEKQLQVFEEGHEYVNAIRYLEKNIALVSKNTKLQSKLEGYKSDYREQLFVEAKTSYDNLGYESAIAILQNGLTVVPDDTGILEKIEEYKKCAPVGLDTLLVLSTESSSSLKNKYENDTIVDLYGNEYPGGFELESSGGEKCFVEFLTDGQYTNLKGSYFVSKNTNEDESIEFRIYADGVKVYQSERINRKNRVIDFDIEINSAESISIEGYSTDDNYYWNKPVVWLTNAYVYNKINE